MSRLAAALALLVAVGAFTTTDAAVDPALKCQFDKLKAVKKKVLKELGCYKRALLTSSPVDVTCITGAEALFDRLIVKVEAKAVLRGGTCVAGGEAQTLCDDADRTVTACFAALHSGIRCREGVLQ